MNPWLEPKLSYGAFWLFLVVSGTFNHDRFTPQSSRRTISRPESGAILP
jgi:hypothetical protein